MRASSIGRRGFLKSTTALGLGAGLGTWTELSRITPAVGREMRLDPDAVCFRPEIEPIVRWIEETPRDAILESAVVKLNDGLSYRDLLGGLFLAGIRNVKPRPVGFKFHAVLVMNSAHMLGQVADVEDRLMPMFWALDTFKNSQEQDVREGDWTLKKPEESRLPRPSQAREAFTKAMEDWDAEAADAAITSLCRSAGLGEVFEAIYRYGLRDHRDIGHKAIFTSQSRRTLETIGIQHAEPVLRSLVFGLLDLQGDREKAPVGPYLLNLENAKKIREDWQIGRRDPAASTAFLATIRNASTADACSECVKLLNEGVAPESLWDAAILAAGELMARAPGILPIHAVTSCNALHYIYMASGDDTTRRLALLQASGWPSLYRDRVKPKSEFKIDAIAAINPETKGEEAIGEIFATIGSNREHAAQKLVGYLASGGSTDAYFRAARKAIFVKGRDSHDYKFGAASWEEHLLASDPRFGAPLAAASIFNLPAASTPESPLMIKARQAVARIKRT
jgi:hypothetical protein